MMEAKATANLSTAVLEAAARPEALAAVERIYIDLAEQIAQRKPVCVASGRCCHFERYGHRLYVTTMELAAFVAGERADPPAAPRHGAVRAGDPGEWDGTGCPFQTGKLCGVHSIRPFGCRIFFCDPTATEWQQAQYERFHGQLRKLHEELGVPYFYVEWRAALKAVGLVSSGQDVRP